MLLYAPREPFAHGYLEVGDGHRLYWEQCGNPHGEAIVFLHGGPGAGCSERHRRLFDPQRYCAVLFDQRGAGRSLPHGETRANTTPLLVSDLEALREQLGIERWQVCGGSWGATLALAYAQAHPGRVTRLILRGVFLGRQRDISWFMADMARFFPEAYARFIGLLGEAERSDPLAAYQARLQHPDLTVRLEAARHWAGFEDACATLIPSRDAEAGVSADLTAYALARLEAHYFVHDCFLGDAPLLDNAHRLAGIPGVIVQGRYDVICPPEGAAALAAVWPEARLEIVEGAGHALWEPGIVEAVMRALGEG